MKYLLLSLVLFFLFPYSFSQEQNRKLNIVVIGAHPDDADETAGGTAIKFAALGHHVLFVSLTNGDAGHQSNGGGALAKRRRAEAEEAGRRFGVTYQVLDNHDGELMPTLNVRLEVIRLIRRWNADIVIGPRPYDYHPDHRNAAIIIQDAAYLVIVPNVASDTPALKENPVFLYAQDGFKKPYPFIADITVDISDVFDRKVYAISAHESQYSEWIPWTESRVVPENDDEKMEMFKKMIRKPITPEVRQTLIKWYGEDAANKVSEAEAFEICEYGRQPTDKEIKKLFPMLGY